MHKYSPAAPHLNSPHRTSVGVVGARGYAGLELCRLLLNHPFVNLKHCFATREFSLQQELFHSRASSVDCRSDDQILDHLTDIVFLATPAEVSLDLAPKILQAGKRVIDLSGAFRLSRELYPQWYGFEHTQPQLLTQAEYGLVPWIGPGNSRARLVANPGCYATAISLALIPLLKAGLIKADSIVIDAKSGTTGAGRKPSEQQLFAEVDEECLPYKVGRHQHLPEIQGAVAQFAGCEIEPALATHLLPVKRGILASIYAKANTSDVNQIQMAFSNAYSEYPLVRHGQEVSRLARLCHVVGQPHSHISYELTGNQLYLFCTLDNLLKGAASQAVENLNRLLDLPTHTGLVGE